MPPPVVFDPAQLITRKEAADLLGLDPSRISQLVSSGHIPAAVRGKMALSDVVRGYARSWQERASQETKTSADSRVRDARAREIEQRIAEKNRHLVPAEEATAAIDHVVSACAEAFAALPAMLTRNIEERKRIETQVKRAQGEVAKRLAEAARVLREGGKLPDAD